MENAVSNQSLKRRIVAGSAGVISIFRILCRLRQNRLLSTLLFGIKSAPRCFLLAGNSGKPATGLGNSP